MDSLPDELLLSILGYVGVDDFLAHLALNMTNRRFHRLTTEHLYQRYPGLVPNQFLRTIALPPPHGCPDLADCVEEVLWTYDCDNNFNASDISLECRQLLASALQKKSPHLTPQHLLENLPTNFLHFGLEAADCVWYLEFFLFFVPKVKRLIIDSTEEWNKRVYWFETLALNPTCFKFLESVTIHGRLCMESVTPILNLPSLRKLEMTKIRPLPDTDVVVDDWVDNPYAFHSTTSEKYNLEHLGLLESSYIHLPHLFSLFSSFKALRSFTGENMRSDPPHNVGWNTIFDFPMLRACLAQQYKSLEHITYHQEKAEWDMHVVPFLDTIDVLPNLKTLNLPVFLCETRMLDQTVALATRKSPPLLTTLTFTLTHAQPPTRSCKCFFMLESTALFLRAFIRCVKDNMPKLRTLIVKNWPPQLGIYPSDYVALQKKYASVGVNFVSIPAPLARVGPLKFNDWTEEGWVIIKENTYQPCGEGMLYFSDKF